MATKIILDGNAFYEIDEECLKKENQQQTIKITEKDQNVTRGCKKEIPNQRK